MSNCGLLLKLFGLPQYNCYQKEVISSGVMMMSAEQLCKGRYSQITEILPGKTESRPRTFSGFLYFLQLYNLCVVKQTETSLKVKNKIVMSSHSSSSKFVHGQHS